MVSGALKPGRTLRRRGAHEPTPSRSLMSTSTNLGLPPVLARPHGWVRRQSWLARFTLMNRILLAMAFLPTGLVKATGQRFTVLPVENPVGFFFEAMYQTGPYWHFIGIMQVVAAILLLVPHTATVGALLFLPISFSILLITWGIGFGNTVYIAAGMTLSAIYLVCWDADRVWAAGRSVIGRRSGPALLDGASLLERAGWLMGGAVGLLIFLGTRGFTPMTWTPALLILGAIAALVVLAAWLVDLFRGTYDPS